MKKFQRVLIMAGGTGGHVFPGLAVAKKLQEKGIQVDWLGTRKGLEAKLVPEAGLPLHFISIHGVRGKGWKDILLAPGRLCVALIQALRILRILQPDVVLGMGGFVSGPGGIAAWLLRKPLVIHEQNARAGTTNKWLSKVAKKVLQGFPNTFPDGPKVLTTGNPVRAELTSLPSPALRFKEARQPLHLLVVGGSMGAAAINELVPRALAKMPAAMRPLVYHQTGEKNWQAVVDAYQQAGIHAEIKPFIVEMDKAYAWADIILCRAGALTIAELCAVGLGAILVPYPFATDDHQTANANFMAKNQAAFLIQQADLSEEKLVDLLQQLTEKPEKILAMAEAAYALAQPDSAEKVLMVCEEISH